jgi:anhydro-N-acetylmuramic acid kinase
LSPADLLRTFTEHAAAQVGRIAHRRRMLITGGGAYNRFLVERIAALTECETAIPDSLIIDYKEALIFAFLGTLYMHDETSCLQSVTGAKKNNIGGMLVKAAR